MTGFWIVVVIVVLIGAMFSSKGRCDICGAAIKRKAHVWTIEGKRQRLCPNCSSRMDRKVSKVAFQGRFGK